MPLWQIFWQRLCRRLLVPVALAAAMSLPPALGLPDLATATEPAAHQDAPPRPVPATRPAPPRNAATPAPARPQTAPTQPSTTQNAASAERRAKTIAAVASWGYQLAELSIDEAAAAPYDLLVIDATTGLAGGKAMTKADVDRLKRTADGRRRLVVGYLSIGEAEDYRRDYFSAEYLEEEAPDWLQKENSQWKGNRIITFCDEGWQRTILGDDDGRNLYNSIEPSPLHRLIELGLDGVYLDRVDVYGEVGKACPDAARRMVAFVKRLAEHARKRNLEFLIIQQNAEELLEHADLVKTIDAIAKEDLFYGVGHTQSANNASQVRETLDHLRRARRAGRPVFFIDYIKSPQSIADSSRRGRAEGFIPYFGPRDLGKLWLPGREF